MKKQLLALVGLMAAPACALFAQTVINTNITTNTQWTTAGAPYIIEGIVYVTNGATLDIAPGVLVRGQPKSGTSATDPGTLIIARGSKIQARGTASTPVVFTTAALDSGKMAGQAASGIAYDGPDADTVPDRWSAGAGVDKFLDQDPINTPLAPVNPNGVSNSQLWGSLVLLGNASHNARADSITDGIGGSNATRIDGIAYLEGQNTTFFNEYGKITHTYDGTNYTDVTDYVNDDDSSGSLNYVSLRHGGFELTTNKELNGLTLAGVGRNTTVRNIEIYCNSDDGIEVFGGTVNINYAVISFVEDDGFDVDQGHRGTAQFIYVVHGLKGASTTMSTDATGFEFDGDDANESGNQAATTGLPYQNTVVYNATVQTAFSQANNKGGVNIRRGFRGDIVNSIIAGNTYSTTYGINIDGTAAVSPSPFVQQSYADRLINIRNTTINGYSTLANTFTATPSVGSPFAGVSTSFTPSTNTGTGIAGLSAVLAAIYPTTSNSTNTADMLTPTIANSGFNPRPGAGPGSPNIGAPGVTQVAAYVKYPAVTTGYRGAFNAASTTLWTTGWTALNKANTNGVKLLVD